MEAVKIKGKYPVSYADAFASATAIQNFSRILIVIRGFEGTHRFAHQQKFLRTLFHFHPTYFDFIMKCGNNDN
jgi:hypothetical protein